MDILDVPENCTVLTPEELVRLGVKIDTLTSAADKQSETEYGKQLANAIIKKFQKPIFNTKNVQLVKLACSKILTNPQEKHVTPLKTSTDILSGKDNELSQNHHLLKEKLNESRVFSADGVGDSSLDEKHQELERDTPSENQRVIMSQHSELSNIKINPQEQILKVTPTKEEYCVHPSGSFNNDTDKFSESVLKVSACSNNMEILTTDNKAKRGCERDTCVVTAPPKPDRENADQMLVVRASEGESYGHSAIQPSGAPIRINATDQLESQESDCKVTVKFPKKSIKVLSNTEVYIPKRDLRKLIPLLPSVKDIPSTSYQHKIRGRDITKQNSNVHNIGRSTMGVLGKTEHVETCDGNKDNQRDTFHMNINVQGFSININEAKPEETISENDGCLRGSKSEVFKDAVQQIPRPLLLAVDEERIKAVRQNLNRILSTGDPSCKLREIRHVSKSLTGLPNSMRSPAYNVEETKLSKSDNCIILHNIGSEKGTQSTDVFNITSRSDHDMSPEAEQVLSRCDKQEDPEIKVVEFVKSDLDKGSTSTEFKNEIRSEHIDFTQQDHTKAQVFDEMGVQLEESVSKNDVETGIKREVFDRAKQQVPEPVIKELTLAETETKSVGHTLTKVLRTGNSSYNLKDIRHVPKLDKHEGVRLNLNKDLTANDCSKFKETLNSNEVKYSVDNVTEIKSVSCTESNDLTEVNAPFHMTLNFQGISIDVKEVKPKALTENDVLTGNKKNISKNAEQPTSKPVTREDSTKGLLDEEPIGAVNTILGTGDPSYKQKEICHISKSGTQKHPPKKLTQDEAQMRAIKLNLKSILKTGDPYFILNKKKTNISVLKKLDDNLQPKYISKSTMVKKKEFLKNNTSASGSEGDIFEEYLAKNSNGYKSEKGKSLYEYSTYSNMIETGKNPMNGHKATSISSNKELLEDDNNAGDIFKHVKVQPGAPLKSNIQSGNKKNVCKNAEYPTSQLVITEHSTKGLHLDEGRIESVRHTDPPNKLIQDEAQIKCNLNKILKTGDPYLKFNEKKTNVSFSMDPGDSLQPKDTPQNTKTQKKDLLKNNTSDSESEGDIFEEYLAKHTNVYNSVKGKSLYEYGTCSNMNETGKNEINVHRATSISGSKELFQDSSCSNEGEGDIFKEYLLKNCICNKDLVENSCGTDSKIDYGVKDQIYLHKGTSILSNKGQLKDYNCDSEPENDIVQEISDDSGHKSFAAGCINLHKTGSDEVLRDNQVSKECTDDMEICPPKSNSNTKNIPVNSSNCTTALNLTQFDPITEPKRNLPEIINSAPDVISDTSSIDYKSSTKTISINLFLTEPEVLLPETPVPNLKKLRFYCPVKPIKRKNRPTKARNGTERNGNKNEMVSNQKKTNMRLRNSNKKKTADIHISAESSDINNDFNCNSVAGKEVANANCARKAKKSKGKANKKEIPTLKNKQYVSIEDSKNASNNDRDCTSAVAANGLGKRKKPMRKINKKKISDKHILAETNNEISSRKNKQYVSIEDSKNDLNNDPDCTSAVATGKTKKLMRKSNKKKISVPKKKSDKHILAETNNDISSRKNKQSNHILTENIAIKAEDNIEYIDVVSPAGISYKDDLKDSFNRDTCSNMVNDQIDQIHLDDSKIISGNKKQLLDDFKTNNDSEDDIFRDYTFKSSNHITNFARSLSNSSSIVRFDDDLNLNGIKNKTENEVLQDNHNCSIIFKLVQSDPISDHNIHLHETINSGANVILDCGTDSTEHKGSIESIEHFCLTESLPQLPAPDVNRIENCDIEKPAENRGFDDDLNLNGTKNKTENAVLQDNHNCSIILKLVQSDPISDHNINLHETINSGANVILDCGTDSTEHKGSVESIEHFCLTESLPQLPAPDVNRIENCGIEKPAENRDSTRRKIPLEARKESLSKNNINKNIVPKPKHVKTEDSNIALNNDSDCISAVGIVDNSVTNDKQIVLKRKPSKYVTTEGCEIELNNDPDRIPAEGSVNNCVREANDSKRKATEIKMSTLQNEQFNDVLNGNRSDNFVIKEEDNNDLVSQAGICIGPSNEASNPSIFDLNEYEATIDKVILKFCRKNDECLDNTNIIKAANNLIYNSLSPHEISASTRDIDYIPTLETYQIDNPLPDEYKPLMPETPVPGVSHASVFQTAMNTINSLALIEHSDCKIRKRKTSKNTETLSSKRPRLESEHSLDMGSHLKKQVKTSRDTVHIINKKPFKNKKQLNGKIAAKSIEPSFRNRIGAPLVHSVGTASREIKNTVNHSTKKSNNKNTSKKRKVKNLDISNVLLTELNNAPIYSKETSNKNNVLKRRKVLSGSLKGITSEIRNADGFHKETSVVEHSSKRRTTSVLGSSCTRSSTEIDNTVNGKSIHKAKIYPKEIVRASKGRMNSSLGNSCNTPPANIEKSVDFSRRTSYDEKTSNRRITRAFRNTCNNSSPQSLNCSNDISSIGSSPDFKISRVLSNSSSIPRKIDQSSSTEIDNSKSKTSDEIKIRRSNTVIKMSKNKKSNDMPASINSRGRRESLRIRSDLFEVANKANKK